MIPLTETITAATAKPSPKARARAERPRNRKTTAANPAITAAITPAIAVPVRYQIGPNPSIPATCQSNDMTPTATATTN